MQEAFSVLIKKNTCLLPEAGKWSEGNISSTSSDSTLIYAYEIIVIDTIKLLLPLKWSIRELGSSGVKLSSLKSTNTTYSICKYFKHA